jgi:hypothetical protein
MKIKILSILVLGALLLGGCKKFFDVAPIDQVYENELFKDRYGFETALSSVYYLLGTDPLYGKEMRYGFLETLVGNYNTITATGHTYYRHNRHEYSFPAPKASISAIWSNMYSGINQLNIILHNLDNIDGDPFQNMIKGEALGLRALAHFELLKLFGPSISEQGMEVIALPYRDSIVFEATKFSPTREILQKIERDLQQAAQLLETDPIRSNGRTENLNQFAYDKYNSLLDRRGSRFNYYAVVALQAIVAQWAGDLPRAGQIAERLIAELQVTQSMTLATASSFSTNVNSNNIRTSSENIFGLHIKNLRTQSIQHLPELSDNRGVVTPLLYPNYNFLLQEIYDAPVHGSTNDFRLSSWYANNVRWKLIKYAIPVEFNPIAVIDPGSSVYLQVNAFEVKILSLHTLHLVAAEALKQSDPQKALTYLNAVRRSRGLTIDLEWSASITPEVIGEWIFAEFRKENVGDGTLFAEYKRLFRAIDRVEDVPPSTTLFNFPVPEQELLYNPN